MMEKNQIFENIMSRTSVRSYTDMPPLAIVVCGCLDKTLEGTEQEFWIQDCSAVTENILLMAHGLGLGGVWTALYPLKERYEGMQQLLHLPKTMIPLNTLIIGYPKNQVAARISGKRRIFPIIIIRNNLHQESYPYHLIYPSCSYPLR